MISHQSWPPDHLFLCPVFGYSVLARSWSAQLSCIFYLEVQSSLAVYGILTISIVSLVTCLHFLFWADFSFNLENFSRLKSRCSFILVTPFVLFMKYYFSNARCRLLMAVIFRIMPWRACQLKMVWHSVELAARMQVRFHSRKVESQGCSSFWWKQTAYPLWNWTSSMEPCPTCHSLQLGTFCFESPEFCLIAS